MSSSFVAAGPWLHVRVAFSVCDTTRSTDVASFDVHAGARTIVQYMQHVGERWVACAFHQALRGAKSGPRAPIVVDIGANAGYYTMLSLALGARVAAFDAQPSCWTFIAAALTKNGFDKPEVAQLVRGGVSPRPHTTYLDVAAGGANHTCDGKFGQRGRAAGFLVDARAHRHHLAQHRRSHGDRDYDYDAGSTKERERKAPAPAAAAPPVVHVPAVPLPSLRGGFLGAALADHQELALIKMDTEGMELGILNASLLPLLRRRLVAHLIFEATPGWWAVGSAAAALSHAAEKPGEGEGGGGGAIASPTEIAAELVAQVVDCGYTMRTRLLRGTTIVQRARAAAYVQRMRYAEDLFFVRQSLR